MSNAQLEIYTLYTTSQTRYVYFLLAAAGAGMGIAINLTRDAALAYSQLPLAGAVGCWAYSFYSGCIDRRHVVSLLSTNYRLLTEGKDLEQIRRILSDVSE